MLSKASLAVIALIFLASMAPRGDNSLNAITRRFIDWVVRGDTVNLNEAATTLHVSKRRLYDVVNVLEGIGVLEKCGMNQCANLRQLEVEMDISFRELVSALKCIEMDTTANQYAYVRLQDLRSSQIFTDKTLIVVKSSTERDIRTSLSQPINSMQSQVKFETSGGTTLQGFISPAGSHVHSDFEQHLFANGCPNFPIDRAFTNGNGAGIKQESCDSVHQEENGNRSQNKRCNQLLAVNQAVKEEPHKLCLGKCSSSITIEACLTGEEWLKNEPMNNIDTMPKSEFSVTNRAWPTTNAVKLHIGSVPEERQNSSLLCGNSLCCTSPTVAICNALGSPEWETWTCTGDSM